MTRTLSRRLHIPIDPPVQARLPGHLVRFDGVNLLRLRVMVEYDVEPSIGERGPFGPHVLALHVVDDTSPEPYPTEWEDFCWAHLGPGPTTTRLERRPPPTATQLFISVLPPDVALPSRPDPETVAQHAVIGFTVKLPNGHAAPWVPGHRGGQPA